MPKPPATFIVAMLAGLPGVAVTMDGPASMNRIASPQAAGSPVQPNAAQLQLALARLGVVGSVLYVAAHPDDENTSLLAYLASGALVRTGYLSITRGDGGQNLIGPEQGPELGLIRTQELLAARRTDGAEQFFTRARDFGFSKSPDETLRIWGHEPVLADIVTIIRRFRPDVIITRFSPEPADTHGHHTASAMLAAEAFRAAADPHFHAEELTAQTTPWQAGRLLWNHGTFGAKPGEGVAGLATLDVGGFNPLLGASYGEVAAQSRSMHKSQGFGVAPSRGPIVEYFKTLAVAPVGTGAGAVAVAAPGARDAGLTGLDFSLGRWPGTAGLRAAIERAQKQFDPTHPAASIAALWQVDAALGSVPDLAWRARKKGEVEALIVGAAGLFVDAVAADFRVAPGAAIEVTATAIARAHAPVTLREIRFPAGADAAAAAPGVVVAVGRSLAAPAGDVAVPVEIKQTLRVPRDTPLSTPYWLAQPPTPGLFVVPNRAQIGAPEDQPRFHADFVFDVDGHPLLITRAIAYKWTDPVAGERYRPLEITPLVSVRPDTRVLMFPAHAHDARTLTVRLVAGAPSVSGTLRLVAPEGWLVAPPSAPFAIPAKGQEIELGFQVRAGSARQGAATLRAVIDTNGDTSSAPPASGAAAPTARGVVHVEHAHIPIQTWLAVAEVRLVPLALETAGRHVGYFPGPGDEVPASLRRVGYEVTLLDEGALREGEGASALSRFDVVVTGVRAFNTSDRLRAAHEVLMKYVDAGGTLVVQYNTNNRLSPLSAPIGPFPFEIGRDRVTDETAAVTFAVPTHPILTTPNAIRVQDFQGWIQERGLYFAETWDARYQAPLAMNDPGEKPLAGSVLWARHGKGTFVYTGLAFFRQLPAGVPGAFRLFANLMAAGKAARGH
jgi:LmbE family N-acetylglucosaminyl deacetylase